jgi:hypothetical protein
VAITDDVASNEQPVRSPDDVTPAGDIAPNALTKCRLGAASGLIT